MPPVFSTGLCLDRARKVGARKGHDIRIKHSAEAEAVVLLLDRRGNIMACGRGSMDSKS